MTKVDSSKINIDKNLEIVIKKKGKKRNETEGWKERKKKGSKAEETQIINRKNEHQHIFYTHKSDEDVRNNFLPISLTFWMK